MAVVVAATTWGNPTASKRVLLIHGLTGCSQLWHRLAHDFASRGYFVVAPDLLGHGCARRGEVYTVAALADELRPFFSTAPTGDRPPYDVVVGHSLGGIVTTIILPLLASSKPVRVVLVDPPLESTSETVAMHRERLVRRVSHVHTPEEILRENPRWTREDAVIDAASMELCGPEVVGAIFDQNVPWSFTHHLASVPENVQVTVLAADPEHWACIREEAVNSKNYPRVRARTVWGASHLIPLEVPGDVIEAALELEEGEGTSKREGKDIQRRDLEVVGVVRGDIVPFSAPGEGNNSRRGDGVFA